MAKALSALSLPPNLCRQARWKKLGPSASPVRGLVAPKDSPALVAWRNPTIDCPDIFKAVTPKKLFRARHRAAGHLWPVL
jgi:hypothetical protein